MLTLSLCVLDSFIEGSLKTAHIVRAAVTIAAQLLGSLLGALLLLETIPGALLGV